VQQNWDGAELARWWSLNFDELALIETKPLRTRLGFAAQMKMYRWAGSLSIKQVRFQRSLLLILPSSFPPR